MKLFTECHAAVRPAWPPVTEATALDHGCTLNPRNPSLPHLPFEGYASESGDIRWFARWHQNGVLNKFKDSDNLFGSGEFHLTWQKGEWEEDFFRWTNLNLRVRSSDTLNGLNFSSSFWQHFRLWKQLAVKSVEVIVLVSLMPRVRILIAFSVKDTFPILSTKKSCNNSSYGNFTVLYISPVAYPDFFYWNQQFVQKNTSLVSFGFWNILHQFGFTKKKKLNKSCLFSSSHTSKSHGLDEKDVSWWFLIASSLPNPKIFMLNILSHTSTKSDAHREMTPLAHLPFWRLWFSKLRNQTGLQSALLPATVSKLPAIITGWWLNQPI